MITESIHIKDISRGKYRFDGSFYLNENSRHCRVLEKHVDACVKLGSIATVFNPGIFKRQFCINSERAVQYFQSSDVKSSINRSRIFVNKKQSENLGLLVHENDILVTGFGTIGNIRFVSRDQNNVCYANNVCRVRDVSDSSFTGYIYSILASKYGYAQLNKNASGSVVRYIEAPGIKQTLIPILPSLFQKNVHSKIIDANRLRYESYGLLEKADCVLKQTVGLPDLSIEDYEYFGPHNESRQGSAHSLSIKEVGTISFNAFCHSRRIHQLRSRLPNSVCLKDVLIGGETFSTGSFPRIEVKEGKGVMLINQTDIFDTTIRGKWISKRKVNLEDNLVTYGEVLIAGVGTLGENETFCRALFASEDIVGQLISGEFIRMKCNEMMPSGYLFTWLNSDYGFRLIRATHSGTKLCRPIPSLFLQIPVPVLDKDKMDEIDLMVRTAFTKRHQANTLEKEAIQMVENEIDKWNNN